MKQLPVFIILFLIIFSLIGFAIYAKLEKAKEEKVEFEQIKQLAATHPQVINYPERIIENHITENQIMSDQERARVEGDIMLSVYNSLKAMDCTKIDTNDTIYINCIKR